MSDVNYDWTSCRCHPGALWPVEEVRNGECPLTRHEREQED